MPTVSATMRRKGNVTFLETAENEKEIIKAFPKILTKK